MCRCMLGTPAGIAQRVDNFQRNAKLTFQMWQNQEQLFTPQAQPSVDIPLPRLLRKSVSEPAPVQPPPGMLDRRTAEAALQAAKQAASAAVTRAALLAGAAGLDYIAPPGFPVDPQSVPKRDVRALEARARAAEQAIAERRARSLAGLASPASLPEAQDGPPIDRRQHPAGTSDSGRRRLQHQPRQNDSEAADIDGMNGSARANRQPQRSQTKAGDTLPARDSAPAAQRPKIKSNASQKPGPTSQQAKAKQKGGPKQQQQGEAGGDAWEAAPEKLLRLRVKDVRNTLKERWLQLFWPEDGRWWPGQVLDIRCKERKIHLLYKTGEEETDLDLGDLIKKGEVAWLSTQEMLKASEANNAAYNGGREGSYQQEPVRDRELPAESPRQRKRPLDDVRPVGGRAPPRQPDPLGEGSPLAPAYGHPGAANGAIPLEDYDEMDPFEHWEQVQEMQQRQMQHRSLSHGSLPLL